MKLTLVLFALYEIAQSVAFIAVAFLVLMILLMLAGLLVRNLTGLR